MGKQASKARESRVNIQISDRLRGGAEPELPFRILVMGDYATKEDKRPIVEVNMDKAALLCSFSEPALGEDL